MIAHFVLLVMMLSVVFVDVECGAQYHAVWIHFGWVGKIAVQNDICVADRARVWKWVARHAVEGCVKGNGIEWNGLLLSKKIIIGI